MKISKINKIRMAVRNALGVENILEIEYKRKRDDVIKTYLVSANFIEENEERFNTYSYATASNRGGIRSFIKENVTKVSLV